MTKAVSVCLGATPLDILPVCLPFFLNLTLLHSLPFPLLHSWFQLAQYGRSTVRAAYGAAERRHGMLSSTPGYALY
jgi:hypothetical protein